MMNRKALLIIDMQKASFTPEASSFDADNVVNLINLLAEIFRKLNFPVIFIQHDGSEMNEYIPHTTEWELLDTLKIEPTDIFINKKANDAFYNTPLQSKLTELNINDLVITGSATDFCVDSTVQSALTKEYNITVVEDGHTSGEKPHLRAEKVIEHYNWVWRNLTPTKGKIEVINFEQLKKNLSVLNY